MGLGDIDGAISKVTATAQNNFQEQYLKRLILEHLVIHLI